MDGVERKSSSLLPKKGMRCLPSRFDWQEMRDRSTFRASKHYAAARRQKTCFESCSRGLVFYGPNFTLTFPKGRTLALNIYVGNLPFSASEDDLRQAFGKYGTVGEVNLIRDQFSGRLRGFGFVEMADSTQGNAAIEALNGS